MILNEIITKFRQLLKCLHLVKDKVERKYYDTRPEALDAREPGQRIYYDAAEQGYYLVSTLRKPFWRM